MLASRCSLIKRQAYSRWPRTATRKNRWRDRMRSHTIDIHLVHQYFMRLCSEQRNNLRAHPCLGNSELRIAAKSAIIDWIIYCVCSWFVVAESWWRRRLRLRPSVVISDVSRCVTAGRVHTKQRVQIQCRHGVTRRHQRVRCTASATDRGAAWHWSEWRRLLQDASR